MVPTFRVHASTVHRLAMRRLLPVPCSIGMLRPGEAPMSICVRAAALPFLLLAVLLAAPCAAFAGVLDRFNPFASFEARCEALPPARFDVVAAPVTFTEDYSQSLRTLTARHDGAQIHHRTVGLTEGRLAYESTLETKGLEDRAGGFARVPACGWCSRHRRWSCSSRASSPTMAASAR